MVIYHHFLQYHLLVVVLVQVDQHQVKLTEVQEDLEVEVGDVVQHLALEEQETHPLYRPLKAMMEE
tara:strand:- start:335 stop:532 length:198 start_codon:yes stop_codon:yes gene_type:complete